MRDKATEAAYKVLMNYPEQMPCILPEAFRAAIAAYEQALWQLAHTSPEDEWLHFCQHISDTVPVPMLMSRHGDIFFWEPEHRPSSTIPTHWRPLPPPPEE